jgi:hypothetical protein
MFIFLLIIATPILYGDENVIIEYNFKNLEIKRGINTDMIQNVKIMYRLESDAILNINEIEPLPIVSEILDNPISNRSVSMLSEYSQKRLYNGFEEIAKLLDINIVEQSLNKINNNEYYEIIKITANDIILYIYRESNIKLFIMEYSVNNVLYDYVLKIGTDKDEIIKKLGQPTYYSNKTDIFIYESFKSLRQINIQFNNNKISKVQLISWGGI